MLEVPGQVHCGHAPAAELALDQVTVAQGFAECERHNGHGTSLW